MRIISGKWKGRIIKPPKNLRARPTTDFAKENLFNVLNNITDIEGADVLDLFAGTGSISYEFASRGAASVTAVEINTVHHNFIRSTAREYGFDNLYAAKANSFLYVRNAVKSFDIIFADPPYDLAGAENIVNDILSGDILRPGGLLIYEHAGKLDFSSHQNHRELRHYGSVNFSLFEKTK